MSAAFSDYRKAVADEQLARTQLERSKLLYDKGAMSLNDLQVAQDTEDKAKVDVENTTERLRVLGRKHRSSRRDRRYRGPGVGRDYRPAGHECRRRAGLGSPNPFTISDLSTVWILCDVYENDLATVHVGETAEIRLNAYPGQGAERTHQQRRPGARSERFAPPRCASKCTIRVSCASACSSTATFPRPEERNACRCAVVRDFALARSRLGLRAGGRQEIPPRGS